MRLNKSSFLCLIFLLMSFSAYAQTGAQTTPPNFLKDMFEQQLKIGIQLEKAAKTNEERAQALQIQAASLDSLEKSDQAMILIDQAINLVSKDKASDLTVTKATIFYVQNKPQEALTTLQPLIDNARKSLASGQPKEALLQQSIFFEGFLTATFSAMQLEKWQDAADYLANADHSALHDEKFPANKVMIYQYIKARDPSVVNAALENDIAYRTQNDTSYYGVLLRMWKNPSQVNQQDLIKTILPLSTFKAHEAMAESLFFIAMYAQYVANNPKSAKALLEQLEQLEAYGVFEWIYGKRLLHADQNAH